MERIEIQYWLHGGQYIDQNKSNNPPITAVSHLHTPKGMWCQNTLVLVLALLYLPEYSAYLPSHILHPKHLGQTWDYLLSPQNNREWENIWETLQLE